MKNQVAMTWWVWLLVLCGALVVFSLLLAFAPYAFKHLVIKEFYNVFFDHDAFSHLSKPALTFLNWIFGATGSGVLGWAMVLVWLVFGPFRQGKRWAWQMIALSVTVKAVVNLFVALWVGYAFDAIGQIGLLIAFWIPLAASYRQFCD